MTNLASCNRSRAHIPAIALATAIALVGPTTANAGLDEAIWQDSFEGSFNQGVISGRLFIDPDQDGDLSDGRPIAGMTIYLDANYNGQLDAGEPVELTRSDGAYRFEGLARGLKHVRQVLPPPNVQTVPSGAGRPVFDGLPDEVFDYVHAAPGVGDFDVPYGKQATPWPAGWDNLYNGPSPTLIDSVELVLQPLGVRNRLVIGRLTNGVETLSLPMGGALTVRFDEPIIDGPGPDFLIHSLASGVTSELADVRVGPAPDRMTSLGLFSEQAGVVQIDLAGADSEGPIQYVQLVSQDNGGSWKGFEVTGFEALHVAVPDPGAHIVVITPRDREFTDLDFGRYAQDLPPTLTIGLTDRNPDTTELRVGESARVDLYAADDVAIDTLSLIANGDPLTLDAGRGALLELAHPGELVLEAEAVDSAGQSVARTATWYVRNADGSLPFDPNVVGAGSSSGGPGAPRVRILSPAAGTSSADDQQVVASIRSGAAVEWSLDYAPVGLVDPYAMQLSDPDYLPLASGSGNVISEPIGALPLASLPDGIYFLRLAATPVDGPTAYYGIAVARNVAGPDLRPEVIIDAPGPQAEATTTLDIEARILSTRELIDWFVEYAPADQVDLNDLGSDAPDWTRIASGTEPVPASSVIASIDATLLKNGTYVVRILARNDIALSWVEPVIVNVTGDAKFGRNRLEFTDVEIDLAGFPLTITRVYDSLEADRVGDFGYGWSMRLLDTDVGETVADTGVAGLFGATPFRVGTRVYLNAPNGRRLGFTFSPQPGTPSALGTPYRAVFEADPGNYYDLEVPQGNTAFLSLRDDGSVTLFGFGFPWNPETYVLIGPEGHRYTIHQDKGLLRAEDRNGRRLNFNPDGIVHSSGTRLNISRDAEGRIVEIADPEGNTWRYDYDAAGNLAAFTDPDLEVTRFEYLQQPAHYLDRMIDPQGRQPRRYEYDPDDRRLVAVIDENGNRRESLVDPQGFVGFDIDARGNLTEVQFNARGNITRRIDPKGHVTEYEYSDPGNPDRETVMRDADGQEWIYAWNNEGRPRSLRTPLASFGNQRIDIDYDADGNVVQYEGLTNELDRFTYDERGNRLTENVFQGIDYDHAYDADGNRIRRSVTIADFVDYGYNEAGWVKRERDSLGAVVDHERLANSRLLRRSDERGVLDIAFTPGGRLNVQVDDAGQQAVLEVLGDGSLSRTDRTGRTTRIEADAEGRPTRFTQAGGSVVETTYDPDGNPATVTDPLGNVTRFDHDSTSFQIGFEDAAGAVQSELRDAHGNLAEIVDRNGRRRTFERDANRRLRFERWHDSSGVVVREIEFIYTGARGLIRVEDRYDGETFSIAYAGELPRMDSVTYGLPGQGDWKVHYDWNNRASAPAVVRVTVDGSGNRARIGATYFADRTARLEWRHPQISTSENEVVFYRNPDGSIDRIERFSGGADGNAASQSVYAYDTLSRMTGVAHLDALGLPLHPNSELGYGYDAEGRLLTEVHASDTANFQYDDDGQLVSVQHLNPAYPDESYGYDVGGNRLTSHLQAGTSTIGPANRLQSAGDLSFEYDLAGNLVRRTDGATGRVVEYAYDHRGRLVLATTHPALGAPPEQVLEFGYDYLDRLLFHVIDGSRTWVLFDRDHRFVEFADGATIPSAAYLYDLSATDLRFAVWRDDGLGERWLLTDPLGSVRGITDGGFGVLSWVDYDGFGNRQPGTAPAADEPLGFAGRPFIGSVGLYDNRRRFLSPAQGRFTQEDPTRFAGGDFNLYRYVFNHPTGFTDPSGEVSATSGLLIAQKVLGIYDKLKKGPGYVEQISRPCQIAGWTATTFGYFVPMAELFADPASAVDTPTLERVPLLKGTVCD